MEINKRRGGTPLRKRLYLKLQKWLVYAVILALLVMFSYPNIANALALTSLSDTMTRLEDGVDSDHEILFTAPFAGGGVAEGETVTITFPAAFNTAAIIEDDVDVEDDGSG